MVPVLFYTISKEGISLKSNEPIILPKLLLQTNVSFKPFAFIFAQLDAQLVSMSSRTVRGNAVSHLFGHETVRDMVHKFVFVGDERNVRRVYVEGKVVKDVDSRGEGVVNGH